MIPENIQALEDRANGHYIRTGKWPEQIECDPRTIIDVIRFTRENRMFCDSITFDDGKHGIKYNGIKLYPRIP